MPIDATQGAVTAAVTPEVLQEPVMNQGSSAYPAANANTVTITIQQPPVTAQLNPAVLEQFTKTLSEMFTKFLDSIRSMITELAKKPTATPPAPSPAIATSTTPSSSLSPYEIVPGKRRTKRKGRAKRASSSSSSKPQGISGGFLWKPVSESDGKLVVLLPTSLTGKVLGVRVLDSDGKSVLATGRFSSVANGNREHFRFSKPGDSFPAGAIVEIELKDGTTRRVVIEKPGARVEG